MKLFKRPLTHSPQDTSLVRGGISEHAKYAFYEVGKTRLLASLAFGD